LPNTQAASPSAGNATDVSSSGPGAAAGGEAFETLAVLLDVAAFFGLAVFLGRATLLGLAAFFGFATFVAFLAATDVRLLGIAAPRVTGIPSHASVMRCGYVTPPPTWHGDRTNVEGAHQGASSAQICG
jgi:hypothetical protein